MSLGVNPPYGWDGRSDEAILTSRAGASLTKGTIVRIDTAMGSTEVTNNDIGKKDSGFSNFIAMNNGTLDRSIHGVLQTDVKDNESALVLFTGNTLAWVGRAVGTTKISANAKLAGGGTGSTYLEGGTLASGAKAMAILLTETSTLVAGTPVLREVFFDGVRPVAVAN